MNLTNKLLTNGNNKTPRNGARSIPIISDEPTWSQSSGLLRYSELGELYVRYDHEYSFALFDLGIFLNLTLYYVLISEKLKYQKILLLELKQK